MRLALSFTLALFSIAALAAPPQISIINDAALSADKLGALKTDYSHWAERVYRYNHIAQPLPLTLVISRAIGIGYYTRPTIYLPYDSDADEMLETFVHELSHHATGHESSFFFKEGIATHTTEAVFKQDARIPQGWPQYGMSTDAWVSLFLLRGELQPLATLVDSQGFDNSSREGDFRGWQSYLIAASFIGWLIENEDYETFKNVFWEETLGERTSAWERRWLASIRAQNLPPFDAAAELPKMARYRYYARRLAG